MTEEIKNQMDIVKQECYKLAQMLNWNRLELSYKKQKKFNDDGTLEVSNIYHHWSS